MSNITVSLFLTVTDKKRRRRLSCKDDMSTTTNSNKLSKNYTYLQS